MKFNPTLLLALKTIDQGERLSYRSGWSNYRSYPITETQGGIRIDSQIKTLRKHGMIVGDRYRLRITEVGKETLDEATGTEEWIRII